MKLLGEKIWQLREKRGLSQEEFAEKIGVSRQTVSNWENDKATPDAYKLRQLCEVLAVSADELLGIGEGDQATPPEQENMPSEGKQRSGKHWIVPLLFALLCLIVAVVGLSLCAAGVIPSTTTGSSIVIFTNTTVFYLFLALGAVGLLVALIFFLKRK